MKLFSISFFIFLNLYGIVYAQTYPIPAHNAEWGHVTFYGPPGLPGAGSYGSISRYDGKDTIINQQTYQHWGATTFTRYENNKMYVIDTYNSKFDSIAELIYYDFNLAVNDTFFLPYSGSNFYAVVDKISNFKALNGETRKEILLKTKDFTCSYLLRWIEGIGDIYNGLFYRGQLGLCDIYDRTVCFADSSGSIYKESNFDYPCESLDDYINIINLCDNDNITYSNTSLFPLVTEAVNIKTDNAVIINNNTNITFEASQEVQLNNKFEVRKGGNFTARIIECDY